METSTQKTLELAGEILLKALRDIEDVKGQIIKAHTLIEEIPNEVNLGAPTSTLDVEVKDVPEEALKTLTHIVKEKNPENLISLQDLKELGNQLLVSHKLQTVREYFKEKGVKDLSSLSSDDYKECKEVFVKALKGDNQDDLQY